MGERAGNRDREPAVDVADAPLVYRGRFVGRPSRAVIEALITLEEADLRELPVTYSVIDLDALDGLYRDPELMGHPAELSFSLGRYRFFLSSDGLVEVFEFPGGVEVDPPAGDGSEDPTDRSAP